MRDSGAGENTRTRANGAAVHWLVRIAERAGYGDRDRLVLHAGADDYVDKSDGRHTFPGACRPC